MFKGLHTRHGAVLTAIAVGLGALGASAAPAQAAVPPTASCAADAALSQPFAAWGDSNAYRLLPGGDFTGSAAGWTLTGGAGVVAGGDPFGLTADSAVGSLSLPTGASATSPYTCVDASQPTFRFLDTSTTPGSSVAVSVVYISATGPVTVSLGVLGAGTGWQPSPAYQNGASIAGLLQGGTAQMALRFTGTSGTSQLDDIFVDPRMGWS